jgi:hypothetical protein
MKRQNSQRGASHGAAESCIALIDARFLAWLQGNTDGSQEAVSETSTLLFHNFESL